MADLSFKLFLALWNRLQGQTTPTVHFRIADWLEAAWERGETRLLLMAFRACGKSTIVGLFAAWLIWCRPDVRILVLAADTMLARKMVRNVKRIIERHPLTAPLKPERIDQWGSDRFTVKRDRELRDPTMLAAGIGSNITGSRADVIICDDVEVPRTCDTADKRAELRDRLSETGFVLVPGGTQLYVGTPHSWFTIYAAEARTDIGEIEPFLHGFARLEVPLTDDVWPERFPPQEIEALKRRTGPNRFQSQMLLRPVNIAEGRLDPALLRRYGGDLVMSDELKGLYLNGQRLVSASAWWDPAFGRGGSGDASVLAVVFTDEDGAHYLHHIAYLTASDDCDDVATDQCRSVARLARACFLPAITVEANGIGKFLPAILRREMARAKVPCAVRETHSRRSKDDRILEAFDVVMAARLLHVHDSVYQTPFLTEMQEWKPGRSGGRDDGLDAVAGALSLEPVRLKRLYAPSGGQNWRGGTTAHQADTEFDV